MESRNVEGPRTSRGGTLLDVQLAGDGQSKNDSRAAARAQPRELPEWRRRRLNDEVAKRAYREAKADALRALTAKNPDEQQELRARAALSWALFKSATLEASR